MISKIYTALSIIFSYSAHAFSNLSPRSKKIWIFIGWHYDKEKEIFADNSKYTFLHTSQNLPQIKVIWISQNNLLPLKLRGSGLESYSIKSIKGIYYSLRAGYTFVDAFMRIENWRLSGGSKIIQLWHGKGMKKTGYDGTYSLKRYNKIISPNLFVKFHKLVASSHYTAGLMSTTFKSPLEKILITGLPRNDVFFQTIKGSEIDSHEEFKKQIERARKKSIEKVILYAPTFRPDGSNPLESLDLKLFNEFLKKRKFHLILSWHPKFARKDLMEKVSWSNISLISSSYDTYPYLKKVDMLITDYSSLYVDFLLLDKPIIFYTFDLKYYKKETGLHDDFENLTPGPHTKNLSELLNAIESPDEFSSKRVRTKNKLFSFADGQSAKRIVNNITKF